MIDVLDALVPMVQPGVSTGELDDFVRQFTLGTNLQVGWGTGSGTGLVSVEYTFAGETAHSAGAPWRRN